jgi:hypothetical protein
MRFEVKSEFLLKDLVEPLPPAAASVGGGGGAASAVTGSSAAAAAAAAVAVAASPEHPKELDDEKCTAFGVAAASALQKVGLVNGSYKPTSTSLSIERFLNRLFGKLVLCVSSVGCACLCGLCVSVCVCVSVWVVMGSKVSIYCQIALRSFC